MTYIPNRSRRDQLGINPWEASNPEELAYVLMQLVLQYLPPEPDFDDYASVNGVLDLVKHEYQRRAVDTFEDTRITLSGDVGFEDLPQNRK